MAPVPFTPSNPHTTTRADFTANILSVTIPESADKDWADAVRHQQGLYRVLFDHEAMARNRQQTFMTPAAHKTAIYHLWDFVGRTLQYFYMVDCEKAWSARKGQDKVSSKSFLNLRILLLSAFSAMAAKTCRSMSNLVGCVCNIGVQRDTVSQPSL
jgi:hypothetical protein